MGQKIAWQYALVWSPEAVHPTVTLYRHSSAGHRFTWCHVDAPGITGQPDAQRVLHELYVGLMALMEADC